jgi:hypothetical protein
VHRLGKYGQSAEFSKCWHEIVHRVTNLVYGTIFRSVQLARFVQRVFFEEAMNRFRRINEIFIPIRILVFGAEDTPMLAHVKGFDNVLRGIFDGIQIGWRDGAFDYGESILLVVCG